MSCSFLKGTIDKGKFFPVPRNLRSWIIEYQANVVLFCSRLYSISVRSIKILFLGLVRLYVWLYQVPRFILYYSRCMIYVFLYYFFCVFPRHRFENRLPILGNEYSISKRSSSNKILANIINVIVNVFITPSAPNLWIDLYEI